ncbi:hypothetical protein ABEB36_011565 [Hypothenemus hampei]|uniref:C-factor n=1 Tax=Hypothenemus hampei TaxID=57062 RepID=A0ABD1ECM2_HYPHA
MQSILITGCNRGLGLGLVRQIIEKTASSRPRNVIATCRDVNKAAELQEIAKKHPNVHILKLDIRNTEQFEGFVEEVEAIVGPAGLNILFNNAGYAPKSTRINSVKAEQLAETFTTNTIGPIMLTKALLPLLKRAANDKNKISAIVNMTSILGSIASNTDGGLYPYRCSKAAVNMATKSLSVDLKNDGIIVTCIHPGWVKTDMGGSNAPMDVDVSCTGLLNFIDNLSKEQNGKFFQWDGKELPW